MYFRDRFTHFASYIVHSKISTKTYLNSYKRPSWWWWCVCHPLFLIIKSASNDYELSYGIFTTRPHFSCPIYVKPLNILKPGTSLPHLKTSTRNILSETYYEYIFSTKTRVIFLQICEHILFYFDSVVTHGTFLVFRNGGSRFVWWVEWIVHGLAGANFLTKRTTYPMKLPEKTPSR